MTIKANKSYTVKDWFAKKVAQEVKQNLMMCDVFAVIKESEKAVYAMLNLGDGHRKTQWVPKSVLVENEIGEDERMTYHHETIINNNYDEVAEKFNSFWNLYR